MSKQLNSKGEIRSTERRESGDGREKCHSYIKQEYITKRVIDKPLPETENYITKRLHNPPYGVSVQYMVYFVS